MIKLSLPHTPQDLWQAKLKIIPFSKTLVPQYLLCSSWGQEGSESTHFKKLLYSDEIWI